MAKGKKTKKETIEEFSARYYMVTLRGDHHRSEENNFMGKWTPSETKDCWLLDSVAENLNREGTFFAEVLEGAPDTKQGLPPHLREEG